ncbi:MAG: class I SAM-dependent methyltransferase [Planctomycetota bacterium]
MAINYSTTEVSAHYEKRHGLRTGLFGDKPYANYGYWTKPGITIDEACDALTDLMAQELELNGSDRLLECGCGYGASALFLGAKYRPREIVGLDVTPVRIEEGNRLARERGLGDIIKLQQGDATKLPFEDRSFTKMLAIECAFHFNTRVDFLRQSLRVLAPGGVLSMTDIVLAPHVNRKDYSLEQLREFLSADAKFICDANIYSAEEYKRLLHEVGFQSAKIYSIKEKVVMQFADHLDRVAAASPPDAAARRHAVADTFRNNLWVGGDYVVVRAQKNS